MDTTFNLSLSPANDEEATVRLQNETDEFGNVVPHREQLTGFDRQGNTALMAVNGSMPVVLHGTNTSSSNPYTFIVFDWHIACRLPNKRFRSVNILVTFIAHSDRGKAEPRAEQHRSRGGRASFWDPVVISLVPEKTSWYNPTPHVVSSTQNVELAATAGFAPYFSLGPKYTWTKTDSGTERLDATRIVGDKRFGEARSHANGVRWDLLENEATGSGVPSFFRTAVLLKRQPDDDGQFIGLVKVEATVSALHDAKEKFWRAVGAVPKDDPIVFDPQCEDRPQDYEKYRSSLDKIDLEGVTKVSSIELVAKAKNNEGSGETNVI